MWYSTVFYGIPDHDGYTDHFARLCTREEIMVYVTLKLVLKGLPAVFPCPWGLEWGMVGSETLVGVICVWEGSVLSIRRESGQ